MLRAAQKLSTNHDRDKTSRVRALRFAVAGHFEKLRD